MPSSQSGQRRRKHSSLGSMKKEEGHQWEARRTTDTDTANSPTTDTATTGRAYVKRGSNSYKLIQAAERGAPNRLLDETNIIPFAKTL